MDHAVAYFNTDVGVAGPDFNASAVPSLKQFVRDITKSVPSPVAGTVYQQWRLNHDKGDEHRTSNAPLQQGEEVRVADLVRAPTSRLFCNTQAYLRRMSAPLGRTAFTTPHSTTLPGSS